MRTIPQDAVGQLNVFGFLLRGNWYTANQWGPGDYPNNRSITANILYVSPFYIGGPTLVDGLGARVYTALAGGLFRLGIYASKKNVLLPGNLIVQTGELSAATIGIKKELFTPILLPPGTYFLAYLANNAINMYQMYGNPWAYGFKLTGAQGITLTPIYYLYVSQSYGSLPDPATTPTNFGGSDGDGSTMPDVYFRVKPNMDWVYGNPALQVALTPASLCSARTGDIAVVGGGGKPGNSYINEMDGFNFPTEGWYDITTTLNTGRYMLAGFNSSTKGYFCGGSTAGAQNEIDGIQFSNETAINPSATLAVARYGLGGINSSTKGYCGGGYSGSGISTEIDGLQFSDETAINPSATIGAGTYWWGDGAGSTTKGYWGGGRNSSFVVQSAIYAFQYSDETCTTLGATLKTARYGLCGLNSATKAYWGGGVNGSSGYEYEIDGIQFSNETAIDPVAGLTMPRYSMAAYNSTIRGYWAGGYYGSSPYYQTEIDGIQFSDETVINPSAGLNNNVYGVERMAGVQSGGIL
jgi:hypothetical protein